MDMGTGTNTVVSFGYLEHWVGCGLLSNVQEAAGHWLGGT